MKHVLTGVFCWLLLSWCNAHGQSQPDSIITTRGAVTLITCGSSISTFQIGDGKNTDYDYRIVDGNVVFIRPVVANPKPTNLVIREGDNIYYMILAFRDKVELTKLKYNLSAGPSKTPTTTAGSSSEGGRESSGDGEEYTGPSPDIDTVTVSNIAEDFSKQKKVNRQYETTADGVTVNFAQAMSLNNLVYLSFRVKNRNGVPYQIARVNLMHKERADSAALHPMKILYRKGPALIGAKDEQTIVYVVNAPVLKKSDEVIMVMYNAANQNQVVLYTPVSAMPKYMISK